MPILKHFSRQFKNSLNTRLVYEGPSHGDLAEFIKNESEPFKEKVQENYDKKIKALADQIKKMEAGGKDSEAIKTELKKEKTKIIQDSINQALKDLKITYKKNGVVTSVTYLDLINHSDGQIKARAEKIFDSVSTGFSQDIDRAVDQYITQKTAASGKTKEALASIPKPTEKVDLDKANEETSRLQEILDRRQQAISASRQGRAEIMADRSETYKARTMLADMMTSPSGGMIDDYDDGLNPFNKINDNNSPTRMRLNGFLYANDIFSGGGKAGEEAIKEAIKEPYKYYHSTLGDSKLTMDNLSTDMALKDYFNEAKKYTKFSGEDQNLENFNRVLGTIAGLLRLADQAGNKRYRGYLEKKFEELKSPDKANDEDRQLKHLYSIQSFPEYVGADPNWKAEFGRIDNMTDPDAPGAKITDYPGTFSDNRNNKTRHNLNGYLYSVYLFKGKNRTASEAEFERAVKMYKASGLVDEDFTQEMIENKPDGKTDSFGLKSHLSEAESYTSNEQVKGVIAGLLRQADSMTDTKKGAAYRTYVTEIFKTMSPSDSVENQMTILSTIRGENEFEKEMRNEKHRQIIESLLEASKQHNQLSLEKKYKDRLEKDPQNVTFEELQKLDADIKEDLDKFVKERADAALKSMEEKYNLLAANNVKLKTPLYGAADLNPLAKSIQENASEFTAAKGIIKETSLRKAINEKYLTRLSGAEKTYFYLSEQLDSRLKAVQDQAMGKAPSQVPPGPGRSPGSGAETPETGDPYRDHWEKAERLESIMGDYVGAVIADSTSSTEKIIARDWKGKKVGEIENGTELIRTEADSKIPARKVEYLHFIRVHRPGEEKKNGLWIPEEQLYRKADYHKTPETK